MSAKLKMTRSSIDGFREMFYAIKVVIVDSTVLGLVETIARH